MITTFGHLRLERVPSRLEFVQFSSDVFSLGVIEIHQRVRRADERFDALFQELFINIINRIAIISHKHNV